MAPQAKNNISKIYNIKWKRKQSYFLVRNINTTKHNAEILLQAWKEIKEKGFNSPLQAGTKGLFETNKFLSLHAESDLEAFDPK